MLCMILDKSLQIKGHFKGNQMAQVTQKIMRVAPGLLIYIFVRCTFNYKYEISRSLQTH